MDAVSQWLKESLGLSYGLQLKLGATLATLLVLVAVRYLVLRVLFRQTSDVRTRYNAKKTVTYVISLFGILAIGRIWFEGFQSLATFLGLLSAGLAIALKDPIANLAGWAFILLRQPFVVGDRVQIGEHRGDVIDQRIFQFTLLEIGNWVDADQSTGRVIHVPNGAVFMESLANYSQGFRYIWNEVPVLVTFESDWKAAKDILLKIAHEHAEQFSPSAEKDLSEASQRYMIFYKKLTPTVYTSVRDCGVLLTMRYLCDVRQRRGTEQEIWEDILEAFAKRTDVDFAYPTQRFYDNRSEGKPGATTPETPK